MTSCVLCLLLLGSLLLIIIIIVIMILSHTYTTTNLQQRSVVNRELCSVLSRGTRTFCYLDETGGADDIDPAGPLLMAIKEQVEVCRYVCR